MTRERGRPLELVEYHEVEGLLIVEDLYGDEGGPIRVSLDELVAAS